MQDQIAHKGNQSMNPYWKDNIIHENDTLLNAIGYFNVDHELKWWMWMLMSILLFFFVEFLCH
jgi:hypothetical protein